MNQFILIVRKELREILATPKFALTFGTSAVLILLAFVAGATNYRTSMARYEAANRQEMEKLQGVTDWLAVRDHRIFLPPTPLASLVTGVSDDIGRTIDIRGRGEVVGTGSLFGEEPALAAFRMLDLDFVIQIVLSLLAILFAYDAVNGEKEGGTLKLALASSVPRVVLISAKIVGRYLAVAVPVLLALLVGCALLPTLGMVLSGDDWIRLALILLTALLYCGAFVALSVAVSAFTHRSSVSFLALLILWISAVLIVPRIAVLFAGHSVDVLSVDDIAAQKTRLSIQLFAEDRKQTASFKPASTSSPDSMMREFQSFMGKLADERDKKMRDLSSRLNEQRQNGLARQRALALGLARLSPTSLFSLAATTLAGTSLSLEDEFLKEGAAYQQAFGNFMVAKTGMNPGGSMIIMRRSTDDAKPKPINPYELPAFDYHQSSAESAVASAGLDMGLLLLLNAFFVAIAFWRAVRYDVR